MVPSGTTSSRNETTMGSGVTVMNITERKYAILQAAAEIFFKNGYSGTSLNAIIAKAGGSKRNFYTEFGGKEGLFKALVTENISVYIHELETLNTASKSLRDALLEVACCVLRSYTEPVPVGLYRIFMMDGARFPEIGKIFLENGPGRVVNFVAGVLEQAGTRGEIPVHDYWKSADIFSGMLRGTMFQELMLGLRSTPDEEERQAFARTVVAIFMDGVSGREGRAHE